MQVIVWSRAPPEAPNSFVSFADIQALACQDLSMPMLSMQSTLYNGFGVQVFDCLDRTCKD